jgi:hypothetical protein
MENKIWERQAAATVTVPQTCKCQEAIAMRKYTQQEVFCHRRQACHLRQHVQSGKSQYADCRGHGDGEWQEELGGISP